ncbi:MAG: hypothetical protein WB795_02980 [Candidatus Acidiferrales bacterium]|jgi:hypothetical protein
MKTQRIIVFTAAIAVLLVIPAGPRWPGATATVDAQSPAPSGAVDPTTLPNHDKHEGLLIAADPYTDVERSKQTFGKDDPAKGGVLPIDVYFRNETDQAIHVDLNTIRLEVDPPDEDHQKVEALSVKEVAVLVVHPRGPSDPTRRRLPEPIPLPKHDKAVEKAAAALQPFAFDSDVLPPHSTLHGFFFFDFGHDTSSMRYADLYIPDVKVVTGNKLLMYFDVPLQPVNK